MIRDILQESIERTLERINEAQDLLQVIEQGSRFFEGRGNQEMRDVTNERADRCRRDIERDEKLLRAYEAELERQC